MNTAEKNYWKKRVRQVSQSLEQAVRDDPPTHKPKGMTNDDKMRAIRWWKNAQLKDSAKPSTPLFEAFTFDLCSYDRRKKNEKLTRQQIAKIKNRADLLIDEVMRLKPDADDSKLLKKLQRYCEQ